MSNGNRRSRRYAISKFMMLFLTTGLFLMATACSENKSDNSIEPTEEKTLAPTPSLAQAEPHLLSIDLQEGFAEDTVRILLDGELLVEETEVTTSLLLGLATTVETQASGLVELEVQVTNRALSELVTVDVSADTYLGISLSNNQLDIIISQDPFGYG